MSLVERVKEQVKGIIKDELSHLEYSSKQCETIVKETSEKINKLIESYADLEKTLGEMHILGLGGITSDTAKVITISERIKESVFHYGCDVTITVGDSPIFYEHPSGQRFKLDPRKNYRFLAAFIPIEEK